MRTTLWVVPTIFIAGIGVLFFITYRIDWSVYYGHIHLPSWIHPASADAARQVLIGIAAAIITVIGVVFSITILALTLASQQFGPRMLRNFVRDIGTQVTLGVFVSTFVYAILALGSITHGAHGQFVPELTVTVAIGLVLVDLAVLIYFIHHIARSIQLPEVIASIARDLSQSIDIEFPASANGPPSTHGASEEELRIGEGTAVPATRSGYLRFIGYPQLVSIAEQCDAVIELAHRPGHFVIAGRPLATVWPASAERGIALALDRFHVTGPHRTLVQDPVFAIDQLVEIAIRALSPAVNDTFTALTCIDWLSDGLCRISERQAPDRVHRDRSGKIRVIEPAVSYERIVNRAFDKIRQAGKGMPAVAIRQMDSIARIIPSTASDHQRDVLTRQAGMILRASEESITVAEDLSDVRRRYESVVTRGRSTS
ncbi:MAG: DUF2254 domain-containing protein [Actinomycetota bacterium]